MNEVAYKEYNLGFVASPNIIMAPNQYSSLKKTLEFFAKVNPEVYKIFHCLDFFGASEEALHMARDCGFKIALHRPKSSGERGFLFPYDFLYAPTDDAYKSLIDVSHLVLFAPDAYEESSSAIWESIKYANVTYKTWKILKAPMATAQVGSFDS